MQRTIVNAVGFAFALILMAFGCAFFLAPDAAMQATFHSIDQLPYVMGGRYFLFGGLLAAALYYGDRIVLAALLMGFAALGVFDGFLYMGTAPLPHFAAGLLAAGFSIYFYMTAQGETS